MKYFTILAIGAVLSLGGGAFAAGQFLDGAAAPTYELAGKARCC